MKYHAFRIDTQWVKNGRSVDGWFVLGQRSTDLNWSLLHEAASFEGAKEFVRGIRESADQLVYGPDGYTIDLHRDVNGVNKTCGKVSGGITLEVHLDGLDEQLANAHELVETIEKARSLADDLAKGINSIELEF